MAAEDYLPDDMFDEAEWPQTHMFDAEDWPTTHTVSHEDVRKRVWITAQGERIPVGKMTDMHILNAYKKTGNDDLLREMVVRLFEHRMFS